MLTLFTAIGAPWSIALAANIKLFPAAVCLWWIGRRDWRRFGQFIAAIVILALIQLILAPQASLDYLTAISLHQVGEVRNISPYAMSPLLWAVLVALGVLVVLRLAPTRWGWPAAVTLSVVGTPRLLIYMLMTLIAVLSPPDRLAGAGASGRPRSSTHLDRRDLAIAAVLVLLGAGIPLLFVVYAGAIGIPSNDDWVYMRGADSLFRTGVLDLPGHTAASIGQLYLVQPLLWLSGGERWAYTAFGLGMTAIGVVATYLLARRYVGMGAAALTVALVLVFPGFARESATFMTDGPTYTLIMLSLLFGTIWLQGGGRLAARPLARASASWA